MKRSRTETGGMTAALVCAGLGLMTLAGCKPTESTGSGAPFKIGVVMPLTGDASVYGAAMRKGIELAHAQQPAVGSREVKLIIEDDQGQARQSVLATQRLVNIERVQAVIGGAMSSTAEAVIPASNKSQVVLLSPTATKPSLTAMGKFFFRLWPSDNYDGQVMAEAAYESLGLKTVSVLYVNTAYGVGITEVFKREFERLGGMVITSDGYPQGGTDFRTVLGKIQKASPDAIYLPGYVTEVTQILKQARQLGIVTRILGVNSLYDPKLVEIAGEAAEGAVFTYPTYDPKSADPAISGFVAAYVERYGEAPDAFAAQGYDAYRVLFRALEKVSGESDERVQIRDLLLSSGTYEGPGGTSTFDENGDVEKPLRLLVVENGKFVPFGQE